MSALGQIRPWCSIAGTAAYSSIASVRVKCRLRKQWARQRHGVPNFAQRCRQIVQFGAKADAYLLLGHPKVSHLSFAPNIGRIERMNLVDMFLRFDELSGTERQMLGEKLRSVSIR